MNSESAVDIPIVRATATDAAQVSALIAAAFHPLAVARWLVPDPAVRTRVLAGQFRILVDHALAHGHIDMTSDRTAVAVWFPRDGEAPLPPPPAYRQRLAAACGAHVGRFRLLDDLFDRHHPAAPHHHLAFLAVHPHRQGGGLGSALLRHHHARLDAHGIAAYLEATSPAARGLYQRHGYHVRGGAAFTLPDGTPIWPMWRP